MSTDTGNRFLPWEILSFVRETRGNRSSSNAPRLSPIIKCWQTLDLNTCRIFLIEGRQSLLFTQTQKVGVKLDFFIEDNSGKISNFLIPTTIVEPFVEISFQMRKEIRD